MSEVTGESSRKSHHHESNEPLQEKTNLDYLVLLASEKADEKIRRREERRTRHLALVFGIASFGLLSATIYLANLTINSAVEQSTLTLRNDLRAELNYQQITSLVSSLESTDTLDSDDIDRMLYLLGEISQSNDLIRRRDFTSTLTTALEVLYEGNRITEVEKIELLFPSKMLEHVEISLLMILHYGEIIVGSYDPVSKLTEQENRFVRYSNSVSQRPPLTGIIHFWKLLIELKKADFQRTQLSDRLVSNMSKMGTENIDAFYSALSQYIQADSWTTGEGGDAFVLALEIEQSVKKLTNIYPELGHERDDEVSGDSSGKQNFLDWVK